MNSLVAFLTFGLISVACALRIPLEDEVPLGKYPYQAAIYMGFDFPSNLVCDGSVLNERYILSSAACLENKQPEDVVVGVGMADLEDQSLAVHAAEKIIVHEKFTSKKFKYFYNIALIRVKEKIVFNARVQPVVLPKSDNLEGGFSAVVTGWGAQMNPTNKLQETTRHVLSHETCLNSEAKEFVTRNEICTKADNEEPCFTRGRQGDPLVVGKVQIGLASVTYVCGIDHPLVFTRLYSYLDWIENNTK